MGSFLRAYADLLKWVGEWIGTVLFAVLVASIIALPMVAYGLYAGYPITIPFDLEIVVIAAILLATICVTVVPFAAWLMTTGIDDSGEYPACPECGSYFAEYPDKYVCPNDDCGNERDLILR